MNAKIVVVGSINVDQVVRLERHPLPGETLLGSDLLLLPGGKGANQAVAAARLGASVSMVGAVGTDNGADVALSLMSAAQVDVSRVARLDAPTGLALINVAANGENTIVVISGANALVDAKFVDSSDNASVISSADVVVLQGEITADALAAVTTLCSSRLVVNLAPVIQVDRSVLLAANPLVVNEHEGELVLKQLDPSATFDSDEALVRCLRTGGIKSVVLTRGPLGALCSDASWAAGSAKDSASVAVSADLASVPAPKVTAVDTSGAGDAFVGALSYRLAEGEDLLTACKFAVRVGAFSVQGKGTQPSYPGVHDALPTL